MCRDGGFTTVDVSSFSAGVPIRYITRSVAVAHQSAIFLMLLMVLIIMEQWQY